MTRTKASRSGAAIRRRSKRRRKRLALAELDDLFGDRLTYRERMSGGPEWCSWELVATATARERLRSWIVSTPRPWRSTADQEARNALWDHFYGDEVARLVTARVISTLPPPVVAYLLSRVTFLAVGAGSRGWAGGLIEPDPDRPWLVVLSARGAIDKTLPLLVAHELAHCWLLGEPSKPLRDSFEHYTIKQTSLADVKPEHQPKVVQVRRRYDRHEVEACALADCWGYPWPHSTQLARGAAK